jgi:hypothetical protein
MGKESSADPQGAAAAMSSTTSRFVSSNGQVTAEGKVVHLTPASSNVPVVGQNHISVVGSVHWDNKAFKAESTCNVMQREPGAIVERHPMGANLRETRTVGDSHMIDSRVHPTDRRIHAVENGIMEERFPLGAKTLAEQQLPIQNVVDNRLMVRRHPADKGVPLPLRYGIEAVGIAERYHSDIRSVGERQFMDHRTVTESYPVDSKSYIVDPRTIAERYSVDSRTIQVRHLIDSRPRGDGSRTATESCSVDSRSFPVDSRITGELLHVDGSNMGERYQAEGISAGQIFPINPRYPVGIQHSIEARAESERRPVDIGNMLERYPLEGRVFVERYTIDPRTAGDRYSVEATLLGERVLWTEEANNVR